MRCFRGLQGILRRFKTVISGVFLWQKQLICLPFYSFILHTQKGIFQNSVKTSVNELKGYGILYLAAR
ncbi:hypothetical protein DXN05_06385 [Deminuibacter soli]|uniref:Uncharacterized protein n=1 Tax=Deminuibacter soli TaxID=2291815 RepID=A0A3E1NKH6_9BACT|nr:hypothetical protein DXN05_06385 [Deminuibacter soli]